MKKIKKKLKKYMVWYHGHDGMGHFEPAYFYINAFSKLAVIKNLKARGIYYTSIKQVYKERKRKK